MVIKSGRLPNILLKAVSVFSLVAVSAMYYLLNPSAATVLMLTNLPVLGVIVACTVDVETSKGHLFLNAYWVIVTSGFLGVTLYIYFFVPAENFVIGITGVLSYLAWFFCIAVAHKVESTSKRRIPHTQKI